MDSHNNIEEVDENNLSRATDISNVQDDKDYIQENMEAIVEAPDVQRKKKSVPMVSKKEQYSFHPKFKKKPAP